GADFYPRAKARIRSNRVNVRRLATLNTGSIARLSEGTVVEVVDRIDIALVKVVRTQLGERNPWHYGENQTAQYNGECGLSTTTNISLSC
ncbi:MAG: peptide-binding protein, partial [Limnospira maxima]